MNSYQLSKSIVFAFFNIDDSNPFLATIAEKLRF